MRPQVVAHRGASHENAEHTLRAYKRAIEVGAEALECDVRLTADGHLICVHDRNLRRTAGALGVVRPPTQRALVPSVVAAAMAIFGWFKKPFMWAGP